MKKRVLLFAALTVVGASLLTGTASAKAQKVDLCHQKGNGDYKLISVSEKAAPAHEAHGDVAPGTQVGDEFVDEDCNVQPVTAVVAPTMAFGPNGWAGWSCPPGTTAIGGEVNAGATTTQEILWVPGATAGASTYPLTPFGYPSGPGETGFIVQNDNDGENITITVFCV